MSLSSSGRPETLPERMDRDLDDVPAWIRQGDGAMGERLIKAREWIDRMEAYFADGLRSFDRSGDYGADGALSVTSWLRWKCKLSGGAAMERVEVARQLNQLPKFEAALARGDIGYQHAAVMAKSAGHLGVAAVRKEEANLLTAAQTMDPGQFVGVAKNFEHRVDAEGALAEANRAYGRRYLHISEPQDGAVRLDGLLDAEGGATLKTALGALMKPAKNEDRSSGQRQADALVELCRRQLSGKGLPDVAGQRPHLIIRASADTVAGLAGAPAGQLEAGGTIHAETVRRFACDSAITRITGRAELEHEISQASRTISASLRRKLEARDDRCVFEGCDMPGRWTDGHHLIHWADGGPTNLENLALLCRGHHIKVHEEGWRLKRRDDGGYSAIPPPRRVMARSRSG
ncbi:MAG: DUF222 domain-containing protein [Chloroflexi bacterium]|nr:MAG: DUF222 domain-containing protein [Chloroflexota bacterium]